MLLLYGPGPMLLRFSRQDILGCENPGEHDFGDGIIPTTGNIIRNNSVKMIGSTILGVVMVPINNDCWSAGRVYTNEKEK